MDVSRETIGGRQDDPLLFWHVCADDPNMAAPDKIKWLTASYQHCQMYAGLSMPADMIDRRIGSAAVMARITDQLLDIAGTDGEIDQFIVQWLSFACDQLWAYVPEDKRLSPDMADPDNPIYSVWIEEINRRMPGLVVPRPAPDRAGDTSKGEVMIVICPNCQTRHLYPLASSLCAMCRAPLAHIQPMPYSRARKLDS
jgi:hypothetical protein